MRQPFPGRPLQLDLLSAGALAGRMMTAPHDTLVLVPCTRHRGVQPPLKPTLGVLMCIDAAQPLTLSGLEAAIGFAERLLFRQRQWCDIVLCSGEDDEPSGLLRAVYELLMAEKFEALEVAPPELLVQIHDRGVYVLDGGLDTFREEYPLLCDPDNDAALGYCASHHIAADRSVQAPSSGDQRGEKAAAKVVAASVEEDEEERGWCSTLRLRTASLQQMTEPPGSPPPAAPPPSSPTLPTFQERLRVAHQRVFGSLQGSRLFRYEPPSKVLPHLFLGSAQNAAMWAQLRAFNISHILVVGDECKVCYPGHFQYMHLKVWDQADDRSIASHFDAAYEFIEAARVAGTAALVHCFCGVSRSATIVLAYLMRSLFDSLAEALVYVQLRRPCIDPNPGFMQCLEEYGLALQARRR